MLTFLFVSLALATSGAFASSAETPAIRALNHLATRDLPIGSEVPERCVNACSGIQDTIMSATCSSDWDCRCSAVVSGYLKTCVNCLVYTIPVDSVVEEGQAVLDLWAYDCNKVDRPFPSLTAQALNPLGEGPTTTPTLAVDPFARTTIRTTPSGTSKSNSQSKPSGTVESDSKSDSDTGAGTLIGFDYALAAAAIAGTAFFL